MSNGQASAPQRILIVAPNWVGDAIMSVPALRAIRELYPKAKISCLMRRYVKPMFTGLPWVDRLITYRSRGESHRGRRKPRAGKGRFFDLAARLRAGRFDLAVLLTNSFRSALLCKAARIPRVVGYDRDGRSFLLTDRLLPARERGKFVPSPIIRYYLGIASYLGAPSRDLRMELAITPRERRRAEEVLERAGIDTSAGRPGPLVILNPGAQYGAAKCWLPSPIVSTRSRMPRSC